MVGYGRLRWGERWIIIYSYLHNMYIWRGGGLLLFDLDLSRLILDDCDNLLSILDLN